VIEAELLQVFADSAVIDLWHAQGKRGDGVARSSPQGQLSVLVGNVRCGAAHAFRVENGHSELPNCFRGKTNSSFDAAKKRQSRGFP
jgi:hypothetical protein